MKKRNLSIAGTLAIFIFLLGFVVSTHAFEIRRYQSGQEWGYGNIH